MGLSVEGTNVKHESDLTSLYPLPNAPLAMPKQVLERRPLLAVVIDALRSLAWF